MLVRRTLAASAITSTCLLGACGASQKVTADEVAALEARIEELERTNGRMHIRIQDTEERIFLLQDRVEANRINMGRRDTESFRVARERPVEPAPRYYESPVTSSAPPPYPDVDPLVSSLPVHRLEPGAVPPTDPVRPDDVPEVVIDQAAFDARFAHEGAPGAPSSTPRPTSTSTERPQPLPPVDVGSHRLPTSGGANVPVLVATADGAATDLPTNASPLEIYRAGVDQFNQAEYAAALDTMNRFVATGPEPDYMDNALYWMGESLYGLGRYSEALDYFQRVVSEYPDGNKVPDSLLKEALTYERLSDISRARDILGTLVETYPTTDAAERARQRLRDLE